MPDYQPFIKDIYKVTGLDLSLYKEAQMKRRLTSLRNKRGFSTFDEYVKAIKHDPQILQEFLDKVTINVSEFYRNPNRWKVLEQEILPKIREKKKSISIWSAACSTGEEPYTLAIIANQFWDIRDIEIIATDIDVNVLARAKQGIYDEKALQHVPSRIIKKYFLREGQTYKVDEKLKKAITYKHHNLLADTYMNNTDIIVCRNVLIYFTDKAKNKIYHKFSNALAKDGILFVGSTEQIFNPKEYGLEVLDTFFYKKK